MSREHELLDQRHTEILTAISGVHERLDTLNGRTRTLENKVSVLSWAYGVAGLVCAALWAKLTGHPQ
jgi:hypothetical protein